VILNHIHLQVRDLNAAIDWFETICSVVQGGVLRVGDSVTIVEGLQTRNRS
jgi:hypothetical protein